LSDVPQDRRDEAVAGYLYKLNEIAKTGPNPHRPAFPILLMSRLWQI
jgi:hypothetical protein